MENEFMKEALSLAKTAGLHGDVPVGAVVVYKGRIIGRGINRVEADSNPTAHAEIEAIREAAGSLSSRYLDECELYVTLEPCPMCAGAIINSRIKRVFFGAYEPKSGCCCRESVTDLFLLPFNHKPEVYGGIGEKECSDLMTNFFKNLRGREA